MAKLTTTSYALLGLLAIKPWTTYELAQQMERSLRNFWPRAQSKIYEEPKNLVAHGLATAKKEKTGKRPRTVYSITEKGRDALKGWLDVPGEPMSIEFGAILKVFFGDQGTTEQLAKQIRAIHDLAIKEDVRGMQFIQEYAETGGPFPERLHIITLMVGFLVRINDALLDWSEWATREVEQWDGTQSVDGKEMFRQLYERSRSNVAGN